jgi:glutathione S-transferase
MQPELVIGSKNYSSWSLRPWLFLTKVGIDFSERIIHFNAVDYQAQIAAVSPSQRVPLLIMGSNRIWDSLAICEYAAELTQLGLPANSLARATARSAAAEMHAGFTALRDAYPMNVKARGHRVPPTPALLQDIARVDEVWSGCRRQFGEGGAWLFGDFSIADAMFAPVCFRFQTYGAALSDASRSYLDHALADPAMRDWEQASKDEGRPLADVDLLGKP